MDHLHHHAQLSFGAVDELVRDYKTVCDGNDEFAGLNSSILGGVAGDAEHEDFVGGDLGVDQFANQQGEVIFGVY